MKTKKITYLIFLLLTLGFSFAILTSFKNRNSSIWCEWKPTTSNIASAGIDNCNGGQGQSNISVGSSFVGIVDDTGCTTVTLTTNIGNNHPAGYIDIKKNGVIVLSHYLTQNQNVSFEDTFSATSGDSFQVLW